MGQVAQGMGFNKVTIINKSNYQSLAKTSDSDIATAWKDGDKQINENQELLDNWADKNKAKFYFYHTKFNILQRDDDGTYIVCLQGKTVCIAREFQSIWFVAAGETKKKSFVDAADAFNKIHNQIFEALESSNV